MNGSFPPGAGNPGTGSFETIRFPVTGMTCGSCVNRITRALKRLDGVDRVRVDLGRETVTVRRRLATVSNATLTAAVGEAGYAAHLEVAVCAPGADLLGPLGRLFRGRRDSR